MSKDAKKSKKKGELQQDNFAGSVADTQNTEKPGFARIFRPANSGNGASGHLP
jgi:hypothetical protein